ncbi:RDD family protein [Streptomyces sp. NPDC048664]|uniref:RDD family protein n=1 Tax=Streptomyces sp. NPDC048664 TaxID=3154505 RepID=UPI00341C1BB3
MSTEPPPPGSGDSPDDDPFRKPPPPPPSRGGGAEPHWGTPAGGEPPAPGGPPHGTPGPPPGQPPHGTPPPGSGDPYGTPPPYGAPGGPPPPGGAPGSGPYGGASGPYGGASGPYGGGAGPHGPYGGGDADPLAGMPPLADGGKRVLARIIDMIIVGIVVLLLSLAFHTAEYDINADNVDTGRSLGQSIIAAVLYVAYDTILIARSGQTLGKKLLNMRVANLKDGSTPSVQASLIRAAVLWLPFAFCCACVWTAICGGWSFFDKPYKQGLHDKAARTVEVSTGPS